MQIWAIGNIAGDSPALRDMILRAGGIDHIVALMQPVDMATLPKSMVRQTAWALGNMLRGKPRPATDNIVKVGPLTGHCFAVVTVSHLDRSVAFFVLLF